MNEIYRNGTLVNPTTRINEEQIQELHHASLAILSDPGVTCYNEQAADILGKAGCTVVKESNEGATAVWNIRFPATVVEKALESVPSRVVLGARDPSKRLVLDAAVPNVYFGTGSETNIYMETEMATFVKKDDPSCQVIRPIYTKKRGNIKYLCQSAKLCNALENVDFFIRNVNLQDPGIDVENKDVNVFFASLLYMTKHIQAGLVNIDHLDDVLKIAEIAAGGPGKAKENPIFSFITCLIKSPLQMVDDTTEKLIAIARKGLPLVISSSPQGGSTAPILEEGMVSLINAEILAGVTLTQLVNPGTPVLYGAVPVRARLDTLHDLYGAPEFIHYNTDCVQVARHYGIPCYSTAGVGDARVPGMQATIEKVFSQLAVAASGAQYIHYAFGLLDKTNIFSPLQAVLDDANIVICRQILRQPVFDSKGTEAAVAEVQKVVASKTGLFARHIRKAQRRGLVSSPYPFETHEEEDLVLAKAQQRVQEIISSPGEKLATGSIEKIYREVPGLLPIDRFVP